LPSNKQIDYYTKPDIKQVGFFYDYTTMRFTHHIFICANQKAEGKACCGEARGMELVEAFRNELKERGLKGKVRAQRSGCLDACQQGPVAVIYPQGTYYGNIGLADVKRIIDEHVINGTIVSDLELIF
jgi:(2Fe-2S) ferredoxin